MTKTKLDLLQKLLLNRNEAVILHQDLVLCSCGDSFADISDIENHLVQEHEKLSDKCARKGLRDVLNTVINNVVNDIEERPLLQQLDFALEPKSFAVCLNEDEIGGGRIENLNWLAISQPFS